MFNNLIESDSHSEEIARRGFFVLGTLGFYVVLFLVGGVVSIYAYNARLEKQNLEMLAFLPPVEPVQMVAAHEQERSSAQQRPANNNQADQRRVLVAPPDVITRIPTEISAKPGDTPPVRVNVPTVISDINVNADTSSRDIGPSRTGNNLHAANNTPVKVDIETPPPPAPTPKLSPAPRPPVSIGVLTGKIINQVTPAYPALAKQAHIQGTVAVQIVVDEAGKVISAQAVSGPPLLRQASVQAAYQTRFTPTLLSHEPVKVTGTITFNFVLQ